MSAGVKGTRGLPKPRVAPGATTSRTTLFVSPLTDAAELANLTFDLGAASNVVVSGGGFKLAGLTENIIRRVTPTFKAGVALIRLAPGSSSFNTFLRKWVDASNYITCSAFNNGGGSITLQISKTVGGTTFSFASATLSTLPPAGKSLWVIARFLGNRIRLEAWDSDPTMDSAPLLTTGALLSNADAAALVAASGSLAFYMIGLASPNLPADVVFNDLTLITAGASGATGF